MATAATSIRSPRTFASAAEWARDVVGVAQRSGPLAAVYLRGRLDATLRERVMVPSRFFTGLHCLCNSLAWMRARQRTPLTLPLRTTDESQGVGG